MVRCDQCGKTYGNQHGLQVHQARFCKMPENQKGGGNGNLFDAAKTIAKALSDLPDGRTRQLAVNFACETVGMKKE